jgi:cobalt-zinc-cadmium efflux system outer membrane protein
VNAYARPCALWCAGLALFGSQIALAADVSLADAMRRALERHPALEVQRQRIAAAQADERLRALAPGWAATFDLENVAGSGDLQGFDAAETTLGLERRIELGDKRAARVAAGAAATSVETLAVERVRADLRRQVRQRYADVVERQVLLRASEADRERADALRERVAAWVDAGRSAESERDLAEIATLRAALAVDDARHELDRARIGLSALWGEPRVDVVAVETGFEDLPSAPARPAAPSALADSLEQRSLALEAAALAAEGREARAEARPDLQLSAGVRRLEATEDHGLVFGLAVPLGTATRSGLRAERLAAQVAGVRTRAKAEQLAAYERLFALGEELEHARHVFETHRDALIPRADAVLAFATRAYERGRASFQSVNLAAAERAALRREQVAAAGRYHRLLADLERLTTTAGVDAP